MGVLGRSSVVSKGANGPKWIDSGKEGLSGIEVGGTTYDFGSTGLPWRFTQWFVRHRAVKDSS